MRPYPPSKNDKTLPQPRSATPWNSIAESIVNYEDVEMSFQESLEAPCLSCVTSPCCTHLPINTFKITNVLELDYARYLLNFDRIELGLSANGDWSAYLCAPCGLLDRANFSCTVHDLPQQPQICARYNPYHCWYKRVFTKSLTEEFVRVDQPRLDFILANLSFDNDGRLVKIPDWQTIMNGVESLSLTPEHSFNEFNPFDPVLDAWQQQALHPDAESEETAPSYDINHLQNPCTDCRAYCCQNLVIAQSRPVNYSHLDYHRFASGFPQVELGITDDVWSLIIKTTCRHLVDHRCALYGKSLRPQVCKFYDEWKCDFKEHFGRPRPKNFLRVKSDYFQPFLETFQFDAAGNIVYFPSVDEIRNHIEDYWRAEIPKRDNERSG